MVEQLRETGGLLEERLGRFSVGDEMREAIRENFLCSPRKSVCKGVTSEGLLPCPQIQHVNMKPGNLTYLC